MMMPNPMRFTSTVRKMTSNGRLMAHILLPPRLNYALSRSLGPWSRDRIMPKDKWDLSLRWLLVVSIVLGASATAAAQTPAPTPTPAPAPAPEPAPDEALFND